MENNKLDQITQFLAQHVTYDKIEIRGNRIYVFNQNVKDKRDLIEIVIKFAEQVEFKGFHLRFSAETLKYL